MSKGSSEPTGVAFMPQLDGLRAVAVGAVLVHHLLDEKFLPGLLGSIQWGFGGVRLFFVLSGFLITGILLRARNEAYRTGAGRGWTMRQFYARRFLRIFPLYYLVIAVGVIVNLPPVRQEFWWLASYLYNFRVANLGWFHENIAHFWSLAVEEQYYLVWPWVVLFVPARALTSIGVVMVLLGPISRAIMVAMNVYEPATYVLTPACLDALGMGALLAMATRGGPANVRIVSVLARFALPVGLLGAVLLETAPWTYGGEAHVIAYDTAVSLIFTWLVAAATLGFPGPFGRMLTLRPVAYCGRIAYGIYVYHLLIMLPLLDAGKRLGFGWTKESLSFTATATLMTLVLAAISWQFFERPLNDLKHHFPYRPPVGASGSAPAGGA